MVSIISLKQKVFVTIENVFSDAELINWFRLVNKDRDHSFSEDI